MTPAETITAAVEVLRDYDTNFRVRTMSGINAEDVADTLERLLPLAELSPEDLKIAAMLADGYVNHRWLVVKLQRAADALEGRQS
jgi:hypothetical protein